jgi:DNA invertase Pin-like site-specific DNA recombinase
VIDFAELLAWFTAGRKTLAILDPAIDTSTPSGRLVANVFAAVAEGEADVIADRTSAGITSQASSRADQHAPPLRDR